MNPTHNVAVFLELGAKRSFAGAIDWPGWYGNGRDEQGALQSLLAAGPRYGRAIQAAQLGFQAPERVEQFNLVERLPGNATTDFGAPDVPPTTDAQLLDEEGLAHTQALLAACWATLHAAYVAAQGKTLRKGPRGGGRELDAIIDHVLSAHDSYLRRITWSAKRDPTATGAAAIDQAKQMTVAALDAAVTQGLPAHGPRGGKIWPVRTFVRRAAWHILDHSWEIEDRAL